MADILQKVNRKMKSICPRCIHNDVCMATANQPCFECNHFMEVVHGRWIPTYHTYYNRDGEHKIADEWHCSICNIYSRDEWPYCPNCGANMMDAESKLVEIDQFKNMDGDGNDI